VSTPSQPPSEQSARLRALVKGYCESDTFFDTRPEEVELKARLMLLDTIGCMLAARSAPEVSGFETEFSSLESGLFTFPGGRRLSTMGAVAVGAMAATWDEACEGHALAHGRPGVPIIAALLPQAVARDATLGLVLDSLVAGYEVGARCGAWLRVKPGMHVDGNWPALGVAAGMARMLDLPVGMTMTAINTAACQLGTSLYLPVTAGATARNTYLAHSAWLGLLATFSAAGGISAPDDALSHYAEHFAAADENIVVAPERQLILESYLKPHAAVRHVHYGAEAALILRGELAGKTDDISSIRLAVYEEARTYCGNSNPATPIQAQFSLSFGVAAGLRYNGIDPGIYRKERFEDAELRRLEKLVLVEIDPVLAGAGKRGAKLTLEAAGKTHTARVTAIKGDATMPMSAEEVTAKFLRYTSPGLPAGKSYAFAAALVACEPDVPFRDLWDLLF
jgi:2-methylcitrate dehydratase PrpD